MALSGFFDRNAAKRSLDAVPPRLQFHGADGSYSRVIGVRDPLTHRYVDQHTPVAFGEKAAIDFPTGKRGWMSFRPYDDSHLVGLHEPIGPKPAEGDYVLVVRVRLLMQHSAVEITEWRVSGVIAQNSMFALFVAYTRAGEAAAGKIPVVALRPSRSITIASRNGELHHAPTLEIVGWVDRDARFGPPTVPLPIVRVGGGGAEAGALPWETAVEPVANDEAAANVTVLKIDPFAGMVPAKPRF
jgi:hypothetical protein